MWGRLGEDAVGLWSRQRRCEPAAEQELPYERERRRLGQLPMQRRTPHRIRNHLNGAWHGISVSHERL